MSPQIRRIIGIVACLIGAALLVVNWSKGYGIGWRPFALIALGAVFLVRARSHR